MEYRTVQESFWAGRFGDEYIDRNVGDTMQASNLRMFAKLLERAPHVGSAIELGANVGLNLLAIRRLLPESRLAAVEINDRAVERLRSLNEIDDVHAGSLLEFTPTDTYDLAFTKGVLIHLNPAELPTAYDALYTVSRRYVCVAEYYNPSPVEVTYRGHSARLFKRDFAGELLDRFPDLALVDYGFVYHRDNDFPQDDLTWFLLEKRGTASDALRAAS